MFNSIDAPCVLTNISIDSPDLLDLSHGVPLLRFDRYHAQHDMLLIRVFVNAQNDCVRNEIYDVSTCDCPPKKISSDFISIFDRSLHTFVIDNKAKASLMVKEINEDCPHARPC